MQTAILCGGKGTRLGSWGERTPKPLLSVGAEPIVWHIMKLYAAQGFDDFVLCLGHLQEKFEQYFAGRDDPWNVQLLDTGAETPTGGRIRRATPHIEGDRFFATYGDGLADIDLERLLDFHRSHGKLATLTAVRPRGNFGILKLGEDERVEAFEEKPVMSDWVNGGFFVFERAVLDYLDDDSVLEREPLERLAAAGELVAYRHHGFWECMDTYKDNLQLNELWESGNAAWAVWEKA